ncbi:MAG: F0F1 ATP synthase subunit B [Treponema sp.]|jgi:F-type H+-transporting ATPase subunit b|nr:F0F1 ATP synthase subunit B [Treponema sp.]
MLDFTVTFGITIINLVILFFILKAILFKPVSKFMEARAAKIQNDIDSAAKDKEQAKQLLERYEMKLKDAQAEAEAVIKEAREQAAAQADKIVAEGKKKVEVIIANANRQIEAEYKAAFALFKAEAAGLVIAASSRLLQRDLNQEDSSRFVKLLLQELAAGVANAAGAAHASAKD